MAGASSTPEPPSNASKPASPQDPPSLWASYNKATRSAIIAVPFILLVVGLIVAYLVTGFAASECPCPSGCDVCELQKVPGPNFAYQNVCVSTCSGCCVTSAEPDGDPQCLDGSCSSGYECPACFTAEQFDDDEIVCVPFKTNSEGGDNDTCAEACAGDGCTVRIGQSTTHYTYNSCWECGETACINIAGEDTCTTCEDKQIVSTCSGCEACINGTCTDRYDNDPCVQCSTGGELTCTCPNQVCSKDGVCSDCSGCKEIQKIEGVCAYECVDVPSINACKICTNGTLTDFCSSGGPCDQECIVDSCGSPQCVTCGSGGDGTCFYCDKNMCVPKCTTPYCEDGTCKDCLTNEDCAPMYNAKNECIQYCPSQGSFVCSSGGQCQFADPPCNYSNTSSNDVECTVGNVTYTCTSSRPSPTSAVPTRLQAHLGGDGDDDDDDDDDDINQCDALQECDPLGVCSDDDGRPCYYDSDCSDGAGCLKPNDCAACEVCNPVLFKANSVDGGIIQGFCQPRCGINSLPSANEDKTTMASSCVICNTNSTMVSDGTNDGGYGQCMLTCNAPFCKEDSRGFALCGDCNDQDSVICDGSCMFCNPVEKVPTMHPMYETTPFGGVEEQEKRLTQLGNCDFEETRCVETDEDGTASRVDCTGCDPSVDGSACRPFAYKGLAMKYAKNCGEGVMELVNSSETGSIFAPNGCPRKDDAIIQDETCTTACACLGMMVLDDSGNEVLFDSAAFPAGAPCARGFSGEAGRTVECTEDSTCPAGKWFPMTDGEATFCASPLTASNHPEAVAAKAQCASGWHYWYGGERSDCFTCRPLAAWSNDDDDGEQPTACAPEKPTHRHFVTGDAEQGDQCAKLYGDFPSRSCVSCANVMQDYPNGLLTSCDAWNPEQFTYLDDESKYIGLSGQSDMSSAPEPQCVFHTPNNTASCRESYQCTNGVNADKENIVTKADGWSNLPSWVAYDDDQCCDKSSETLNLEGQLNASVFAYPSCMCSYDVPYSQIEALDATMANPETMARLWTPSCYDYANSTYSGMCKSLYACTPSGEDCVCPECYENIHCYASASSNTSDASFSRVVCDNQAFRNLLQELSDGSGPLKGMYDASSAGAPTNTCIPWCSIDPARGLTPVKVADVSGSCSDVCPDGWGVDKNAHTGCMLPRGTVFDDTCDDAGYFCPFLVEPGQSGVTQTTDEGETYGCGTLEYSFYSYVRQREN